jgi:CubicO group peptidase (beta-lactamase class C family)
LAPASTPGALASDNPRASDQDRFVDRASRLLFSNTCHVGLSIAVVRGSERYFYDYGSTSREVAKLPTRDSIYEIGSVTKTFTGALAAQGLVDQRVALDADFRSYLPGSYPNLVGDGKPMTLRTLATHRSGLPRDLPETDDLYSHVDFETLPYRLIVRDSSYDHARYLRELHGVQLTGAPGASEAYSNLGLKVLGFGLETALGAPFETLVQRGILQPLGMSSTGFVVSIADRPRLVQGYSRGGHRMPYHLRNAGAAYGLYSSTRDMAQYLSWQLDESLPVIRRAHEPLVGDQADGKALIWNLSLDSKGRRLIWHGGGTFGMTSQVVLFPEDHAGFVLLANDTCEGTESGLKELAVTVHDSLGR